MTGSLPLALHEQFGWRFCRLVMGRRKLRASPLAGTRLEQGTIIVLVELLFYGRAVWCFIVRNPLILSSTLKVWCTPFFFSFSISAAIWRSCFQKKLVRNPAYMSIKATYDTRRKFANGIVFWHTIFVKIRKGDGKNRSAMQPIKVHAQTIRNPQHLSVLLEKRRLTIWTVTRKRGNVAATAATADSDRIKAFTAKCRRIIHPIIDIYKVRNIPIK